jgi:hypothetical protein
MKTKIALAIFIIQFLSITGYTQVTKQLDTLIYSNAFTGGGVAHIDNFGNTYLSYFDEFSVSNIVMKINSCGNTEWQVQGPSYRINCAIKTDNNNDPVLVCDTTTSTSSKKMIRFDKNNGAVLNSIIIKPSGQTITDVNDILFDTNNNIIVFGANLSNSGFVAKYTPNFTLIWVKFPLPDNILKCAIINNKIICLNDGFNQGYKRITGLNLTTGVQVFQTGSTGLSTGLTSFDTYNNKIYTIASSNITKLDTVGAQSLVTNFSGISLSHIISNSTGIYVDYDSTQVRKVIKTDLLGNEKKRIPLQMYSIGINASFKFANNKLYITGLRSNTPSLEKEINILDTMLNITYMKVDTNYSPNNHTVDRWNNFSVNNSGEYVLAGTVQDSPGLLYSLLKIYSNCLVTGAKEQLNTNNFKIYPNPTSVHLNISGLDINQKQITITNVIGDNVRIVETNGNKSLSVDVENLSPGVYFINSNNKSSKFIKE